MAGRIKQLIDQIVERRAKGNLVVADTTRAKLIFKGINPDRYSMASPDDPEMEERIRAIAVQLGVTL
jgi:hypothetical protein